MTKDPIRGELSIKNIFLSAALISPTVEKMKNHLLLEGDLVPVFDSNSLKGKSPSSEKHGDEHIIKKSSHINRLKDSHLYMYKNEPIYYSNPTPAYEPEYTNQEEVYEGGNEVYENAYQQEENPSNNNEYTPSNYKGKEDDRKESYEEKKPNKKRRRYKKKKHDKGKKKHNLKLEQESPMVIEEKKEHLKTQVEIKKSK